MTPVSVEEPLAPHVAGVAALVRGPDEAPAGPGVERQVDAGAQPLVAVGGPVAAHDLAVGDAAAQAAQPLALFGAEQVGERHQVVLLEKGSGPGAGPVGAGRQAQWRCGCGRVGDQRRGGGGQNAEALP